MTFGVDDQRILWPAAYPDIWNGDASSWYRFADQASSGSDDTGSIAIANPASGPGTSANTDYLAAINYVRGRDHKVVGYVSTAYGVRPLAQVKADVDKWYELYTVDGIFVDEMSTNSSTTGAYYRDLYTYVRTQRGDHLVVGNPGTAASTDWQIKSTTRVCDLLCVFEGASSTYLTWSPPAWASGYAASWFCHLVHTCPSADFPTVLARTQALGAGWRYVTDQSSQYASLAYWPQQATP